MATALPRLVAMNVVAAPYSFSTGGYAEGFLRDWWNALIAGGGDIVEMAEGYRLTPKAEATALSRGLRD